MHKLPTLFFFIVFAIPCSSQVNWQWGDGPSAFAGSAHNQYNQEGYNVAPGPNGGAYIMGWIYDTVVIGQTVTPGRTNGQPTFFIALCDAFGNFKWIRSELQPLTSTSYAKSWGLASDYSGNAIITGQFTGDSMVLGNNVVLPNSVLSAPIFTIKYNSNGDVVWARSTDEPANAEGFAVATDTHSNVYVTGDFYSDTIVFGQVTLTKGGGGTNIFIVKYDSSGNVLWAKNAGESGNQFASGNALATDHTGNVYVAGTMACSSLTFGPLTITNRASVVNQMFLLKLDSSGNGLWGKISYTDGSSWGSIANLAIDGSDNLYATGYFLGPVTFGSLNMVSSLGNNSMFLLKYNQAGSLLWNKTAINNSDWEQSLNNGSFGSGVATGANNEVYVCGGFSLSVTVDSTTVSEDSVYNEPFFVFDLDSAGNVLCADALISGGDDQSGICSDGRGNIYVCGDYEKFPFVLGPDTLQTTLNSEQFFVGKYNCGNSPCNLSNISLTSGDTVICPNDTATICAPAGYSSYRWSSGDSIPCAEITKAGTYNVTVTQRDGCTATSNQVTVGSYPATAVTVIQIGDTFTCTNPGPYVWLRNGEPIQGATSSVYIAQTPGSYTAQIIGAHGCRNYSTPTVILGVNQLYENSIAVFPNPTAESWQLNVTNQFVGSILEIFDAEGKLVYQSVIKNEQSIISIPGIAKGIYQLRVTSGDLSIVRKLVKL